MCLLKQQLSITVYPLPTKENKLSFSVSVCSKQTEVFHFHFPLSKQTEVCHFHFLLSKQTEFCHFRFPFAANKWKLPFSLSLSIYICIFLLKQQHVSIYTTISNGKRKPRQFFSFYRLLIVQIKVCHLSICWWRNKRKLSVCLRNKRACPSMLYVKRNMPFFWNGHDNLCYSLLAYNIV